MHFTSSMYNFTHILPQNQNLFPMHSIMDFTPLPSNSNPNPNPIQELPHLLTTMEINQFTHSTSSPFKNFSTRPYNFKKSKRGYSNHSIPFYQSSKYQTPNPSNPRPRKPSFQRGPNKSPSIAQLKRIPKMSPPPPKLINPSHSKKVLALNKNIQPGLSVEVMGRIEKIMKDAKIDNLVYHPGKHYYPHLMSEFYCNMRVQRGLDGVMHFTSVVGGKLMLVDHKTINRALLFPSQVTNQPCIDIYSFFVFNKQEFQLLVSNFCDDDIPIGMCNENCGIHYKHFNPTFQQLALILRANILPKPSQSKYFDFFDLKIMFHIITNKIDFSISYLILLNMINASYVEYMPYGALLSAIFNVYHVYMHLPLAQEIDSHLTLAHVRTQVPLSVCEPQKFKPTIIPPAISEEDISLTSNGSVKALFEEQKTEIRTLKSENMNILARLNYLEGLAAGTLGNSGNSGMEMDIVNLYQVQMTSEGQLINEIDMLHELETVGMNVGRDGNGNLPGLAGYVADMENID